MGRPQRLRDRVCLQAQAFEPKGSKDRHIAPFSEDDEAGAAPTVVGEARPREASSDFRPVGEGELPGLKGAKAELFRRPAGDYRVRCTRVHDDLDLFRPRGVLEVEDPDPHAEKPHRSREGPSCPIYLWIRASNVQIRLMRRAGTCTHSE